MLNWNAAVSGTDFSRLDTARSPLASGEKAPMRVRFSPTALGLFKSELAFNSDGGSPILPLIGTGIIQSSFPLSVTTAGNGGGTVAGPDITCARPATVPNDWRKPTSPAPR